MAALTAPDYPRERAAIVVITTERETSARTERHGQLAALAAQPTHAPQQLRSLFPAARCRGVVEVVNAARPADRLRILTGPFDAEPTTADVVQRSPPRRPRVPCRWCTRTSPMSEAAKPDS